MDSPSAPTKADTARPDAVHLRSRRTSWVIAVDDGVPTVLHWGTPIDDADAARVAAALARPVGRGALDIEAPVSLLAERSRGFPGRPGLVGARPDGSGWAPCFATTDVGVEGTALRWRGRDDIAGLELSVEIDLDERSGLARITSALVNVGATDYVLQRLAPTLPLPAHATELLAFHGRWCRELHPDQAPWPIGAVVAENHRGRTSHDHLPIVFAGTAAFGEDRGEVWGVHLAWSGNHVLAAERLADGRRSLQAGELLDPGEIVLAPGERYESPIVFAAHGSGTNEVSDAFHTWIRARVTHPRRPRPVTLNTWEAIYFDHDHTVLRALAERAASVGVERFVLDDGWFGGRRHDRAGLGDWYVSPDVYPDGLTWLIDHVRSLGMEFGLWVEPEMVNPDSDLFRAHPEWVLAAEGYPPVLGRGQLVLDLARADVADHLYERLDALLHDDIAYLKWDMNRDLVHATHEGRAGTHAQTIALYALLDRLRSAHPDVEIESCASGGGRVDLAILERTCRVWASDCNDPLERAVIQRGFSYFLPPELVGCHIGPPRAHTTNRRHELAFRGAVALPGHLGVEWNLLEADETDLAGLREVISLHKRLRPLLHAGRAIRLDHPDGGGLAHAVLAPDGSEAVVSYTQLRTTPALVPMPLRIVGLRPDTVYEIAPLDLPGQVFRQGRDAPRWWPQGLVLSGRQLASHGLQLPVMAPESTILLALRASGGA